MTAGQDRELAAVAAGRIAALVERTGLGKKKFAASIGAAYSTVYSWLDGRTTPSTEALVKIARRWDVSVDWLLGLVSSPDEQGIVPRPRSRGHADPDAVYSKDTPCPRTFDCRRCGKTVRVSSRGDRRTRFCSQDCEREFWRHRKRYETDREDA